MWKFKISFLKIKSSGFTLIEVLVAFLIIFLAIILSNTAYKQYASYRIRQKKLANYYISALAIVNKIESIDFSKNPLSEYSGKLNGIPYTAKIQKIASKRNYVYSKVVGVSGGNRGDFMVKLYKITLKIGNRNFILYKTGYRKLND